MGYTKPTETTKHFLENSPLPRHGSTYTVIPHKDVMKHTHELLNENGFTIERELFRANMNAQVAQGIYHLTSPSADVIDVENDIGLMFAWTNSYDKSTRFQCAIGGYVFVCYNGLVSGDMANFARKHTGSANIEVQSQISSQIRHAAKFFNRLVMDKDSMKLIDLPIKEQAELLGRLFVDEKLLDVTQMSCVKNEIEVPSYNYNADKENAWTFYNHVTMALKKSHPRSWLSDQQKFHEFMTASVLSQMGLQQKDVNTTDVPPVLEDSIIDETDSVSLDTSEVSSVNTVHSAIDETKDGQPYSPDNMDKGDGFSEMKWDDDTDEVIIDEFE